MQRSKRTIKKGHLSLIIAQSYVGTQIKDILAKFSKQTLPPEQSP